MIRLALLAAASALVAAATVLYAARLEPEYRWRYVEDPDGVECCC